MSTLFGKKRTAVITTVLLCALALPALASEVPETGGPGGMREAMKERREEYQSANGRPSSTPSFRERVVERRAQFASGVKDRLKNLLSNVTDRLIATADRFDQIIARIEARETILRERGADTSAVDAALTRAQREIDQARTLLTKTNETEIDLIVDDALPRNRFSELKGRVGAIRGHLAGAHASLKDAVVALRAADTAPIDTAPAPEAATATTTDITTTP